MTLPRHVAIVMDGNGRWARQRLLPRAAGHKAGVKPVRLCVEECARRGIGALTLFAFSSENWARPGDEVSSLMGLFISALEQQVADLHRHQVRLRFIGDRSLLAAPLLDHMSQSETLTAGNKGLQLQIAIGYGGRWDIVQAARQLAQRCVAGELSPDSLHEQMLADELQLAGLPDPDLFIRTGGEQRISNFLLWNLAYSELYFTEQLWPDFDVAGLQAALTFFAGRNRRYGLTGEQVASSS